MERLDKIKKLNWFHYLILKALISEPSTSLSTKQFGKVLKTYFDFYGLPYDQSSRRVFFMQKISLLLDLGIVAKIKGPVNIYYLNKEYKGDVVMLVAGYFGILGGKTNANNPSN